MSEEQSPVRWPANRVAAWLNVPMTTCKEICMRAGMNTKDGFDILRVAPAVVAHYKSASERASQEAERDRARKAKADADMAEMERGKMQKNLGNLDRMGLMWRDGITDITKRLQALPWLKGEQLEQVFAAIRGVNLPSYDEEEAAGE